MCSYFLSRDVLLHSFVLTGNMFNKPALERALYDGAGVDHVNIPTLDKVYKLILSFLSQKKDPALALTVWSGLTGLVVGRVEALTEGHKKGCGQGKK